MKLSKTPSKYIVIRATTNAQRDRCNFAIIHLTERWKKEQQKRIELLGPLQEDSHFDRMSYYDRSVDFYAADANEIEKILTGNDWAFITLQENEAGSFTRPEASLEYHRVVMHSDGSAYYTACGKDTSEKFWTEKISLTQILKTKLPLYITDLNGDPLEIADLEATLIAADYFSEDHDKPLPEKIKKSIEYWKDIREKLMAIKKQIEQEQSG